MVDEIEETIATAQIPHVVDVTRDMLATEEVKALHY